MATILIIISAGSINKLDGRSDRRAKVIPFPCRLFTKKESVNPNIKPLSVININIMGIPIKVAPRIHMIKHTRKLFDNDCIKTSELLTAVSENN